MPKQKTVLIVDDSAALVDWVSSALEDAGYRVGCASDGEEVFRKLATLDPAVVFLDVYMPKLDGGEVCRLVKAHPHWKETYLVLMSARLTDREIETYRALGADEVLKKPFEVSAAVAITDRVCSRP
jgi:twitching motility two-component system response regulator PilG/twitching motility two-component system response regulator PilH